jgi:hypothetical protein
MPEVNVNTPFHLLPSVSARDMAAELVRAADQVCPEIGRAITVTFAAERADVVVSGRSPERSAEVSDRLRRCESRCCATPPSS